MAGARVRSICTRMGARWCFWRDPLKTAAEIHARYSTDEPEAFLRVHETLSTCFLEIGLSQ